MSRVTTALLVAALGSPIAAQEPLPDGIYKIDRHGTQRMQVAPVQTGEQLLIHNWRYFEPAAGRSDQLVVVLVRPDVPLELGQAPEQLSDAEGRPSVRLVLNASAAEALEKLTREKPGARYALVVDGEVVIVDKIREPITGGEIVVAGCRDVACELLRQQLADNVRPSPGE